MAHGRILSKEVAAYFWGIAQPTTEGFDDVTAEIEAIEPVQGAVLPESGAISTATAPAVRRRRLNA